MNVKLTSLEWVFAPMSSQESEWFRKDAEVEQILRDSDFYMLAGRAEAKFENFAWDDATGRLSFDFTIGDHFTDAVTIDPGEFGMTDTEDVELGLGPKIIRVLTSEEDPAAREVLQWATTERLLWLRSHDAPGIYGFNRFREAAVYDLLYVGIAKKGDSFDRLFKNGHKAHTRILSNEPQRYPGARVADEIYLFLYRLNPLVIRQYDPENPEGFLDTTLEMKRIVADAEKAYVHLLTPNYNDIKFKSYPRGDDGLFYRRDDGSYEADYTSYGYVIAEDVLFNTANGSIRGARDNLRETFSDDADGIHIHGETVEVIRPTDTGPASSE